MTAQHTYSNVLGILGNICSMLLFLSPLPTFWKIWKTKEVGQFTPAPYVFTVLNCSFWIIYGLPAVKDAILIISINSAGLVVEFCYVSLYMWYATGTPRRRTSALLGACAVLYIIIVCVALVKLDEPKMRTKLIGSVCVIIGIFQSFAPLTVMAEVIKTKSVEYLPIGLSSWIFMNGSIWTAYGCWPADVFIIIPNAASVFFGICQITLWCIYRKSTPKTVSGTSATDRLIWRSESLFILASRLFASSFYGLYAHAIILNTGFSPEQMQEHKRSESSLFPSRKP